jgi:hypothetical protein
MNRAEETCIDQITSEDPNFRQLVTWEFFKVVHRYETQVRFLPCLLKIITQPFLLRHLFYLQLCRGAEYLHSLDFGPPPVSEVRHYSHSLKIAAPVATLAALLGYVLWIESMQTEATFPRHASNLPRDRTDAIAQGLINIGRGYHRLPLQ